MDSIRKVNQILCTKTWDQSPNDAWLDERYRDQLPSQDRLESSLLVRVRYETSHTSVRPSQTSSLRVTVGPLTIELLVGNSDHDLKRVLVTLKEMI